MDEDLSIIKSNTRNERIKNFILNNKKSLIAFLIMFFGIIISFFGYKEFKKSNLSSKEKDAFDILELNYSAKWQEIQQKFKYLVKKYHPDKNHGSKKFEDKLKKITLAYSQLKMNLGKK